LVDELGSRRPLKELIDLNVTAHEDRGPNALIPGLRLPSEGLSIGLLSVRDVVQRSALLVTGKARRAGSPLRRRPVRPTGPRSAQRTPRIGEVDQLPGEHHLGGRQQMLLAPAGGHRRGRQILERRGAESLGEGSLGLEIGPEIGQDLSQRSLRALGAVDGPKAPPGVIEAVVPGAELKWRESQWVTAMPDPPKLPPAHPSKLTSCLAAARTTANCAGFSARRRTSIGASSSRRVLVPKSQTRAVFSSKLSTIMRTIL